MASLLSSVLLAILVASTQEGWILCIIDSSNADDFGIMYGQTYIS